MSPYCSRHRVTYEYSCPQCAKECHVCFGSGIAPWVHADAKKPYDKCPDCRGTGKSKEALKP